MAIVDVEHARDLAAWSGRALGTTPWSTITQATIGAFADATGDDHWIHVDTGRAAREMPGGRIAHGLPAPVADPGPAAPDLPYQRWVMA